jgi:outer membrane protein OmpA-like peptidoglycan-associated protein
MAIKRIRTLRYLLAILSLICILNVYVKGASFPEKVGPWENISGFTINTTEDYMVLSITIIGRNQLFETTLKDGVWSEPVPIESINVHHGQGFEISGPTLNYNGKLLLFHANFPNSKGGLDLYYSEREAEGWGAPKNLGPPINTSADELYPSLSPGEDRLFFTREKLAPEVKKPKDSPNCQSLFMALKNPQGKWGEPSVLHEQINRGCEHGARIGIDGKTLYYSAVDIANPKVGYNPYFTQEVLQDSWLLPVKIDVATTEESAILPQYVNGKIYYLKKSIVKRLPVNSIYKVDIPENYFPLKTITARGMVIGQANKKPIETELTVFDPTTLKVLGVYKSDKQTGIYEMPLLDGKNYIVDIRKAGYSFASFMVDLRHEEKIMGPQTIDLFQNIELSLSVYDNEIFRPLDATVVAESLSGNGQKFEGKKVDEGIYTFSIPMGQKYRIKAEASKFDENSFEFDLNGDIIFSRFERNLPLIPRKKAFEIIISDKDTEEGLMAEVIITNLNREETIFFSAQDVKDGKITAMLREGDQYEFTIRGAQGYSFHNQVVDLAKQETSTLTAELVSLKAQTSIRLNNINFGSNSADLTSESFPELNRVVQLIKDNPAIVIEIAAHTDNVGSGSYNMVLSEKRAQSVVNYLLDNSVAPNRLVAKGYGLKSPMVPNTSDENRALNRRVEFKILEILSE